MVVNIINFLSLTAGFIGSLLLAFSVPTDLLTECCGKLDSKYTKEQVRKFSGRLKAGVILLAASYFAQVVIAACPVLTNK